MKTIKIVSVAAFLVLSLVIALTATKKHPMDKELDQVIAFLMEQEELVSTLEVLEQFPELEDVIIQIHEIKEIRFELQRAQNNPFPPAGEACQSLFDKMERAKDLEKQIHKRLKQITSHKKIMALITK